MTYEKVGLLDEALVVYRELEHAFWVEKEAKGKRKLKREREGGEATEVLDDFMPVFIQVASLSLSLYFFLFLSLFLLLNDPSIDT